MSFTKEQIKAINSRGADLLVSAGAGSGKTRVMIERICSLLREGADINRMLVCTFTKTAAADMKRKLAEALTQESDARARRNLSRLSSADISTLHSWCARLIKTWFFRTDLDPSFTVLEEGEELMLKRQAAEEAVEKLKTEGDSINAEENEKFDGNTSSVENDSVDGNTSSVENDSVDGKNFAGLYEAFRSSRSHHRLVDAALAVYDYSRAQSDPEAWLARSAQKSDTEYREELAKTYSERVKILATKAEKLLIECKAAGAPSDFGALCALEEAMEKFEKFEMRTVPIRRSRESEEAIEIHESYMALKKAYGDLYAEKTESENLPSHESSLGYCRALASLAREAGVIYSQRKSALCKADYADLEHCALAVLRGEEGGEIARGYDYVFVDEYQDISPLQEEILSIFKARNPNCNMFYVGDVKQSIYGFRMCGPEYFLNKQKEYRGGKGEAIDLNTNFRSGKNVLDAVNRVFCKVMTEDFGKVNYRDDACLTSGLDFASGVSAVLTEPTESEEQKPCGVYSVKNDCRVAAAGAVSREADAAVDEIISLLEEGYEFGDIAVLVRSRGRFADILADKLRAQSVPVSVVSSDSSADSFESVSALISFMRLLDNTRDDVNMAAVMLSPVFGGFSPDDLAEIAACGSGAFCERVIKYAANDPSGKVGKFVRKIADFRALAAECSVSELAGKITAEYKCFNHALAAGGEREAAALDAFCENLAASERDTLGEYIAFINDCGAPKIKVTDGGRAVSIMTVHASKGLEFPCVLLCELDKQFNRSDTYASVICDRDEGIVLRTFDFDNRTVTENPRYACAANRLRREQTEEELRILYVAMTRAKERLIMFAESPSERGESVAADKAGAYTDWLYELLADVRKASAPAQSSERTNLRTEADERICSSLEKRFEREEKSREENARACAAVKVSVSGIAHRDYEEDLPRTPSVYSDDRAAERGSAYHKFMQYAEFGKAGEWERLCALFPDEGELIGSREEIETAFAAMEKFIGGREFYREKAFVCKFDPSEIGEAGTRTTLVQGVIDLLVLDGDGAAEIVDYKTGSGIEENPAYAVQLDLYRKAVERALGMEVKAAYLYGFSSGKFHKVNKIE